jgi:hypothetical protein
MIEEKIHDCGDQRDKNNDIEDFTVVHYRFPVFLQVKSADGEKRIPDSGTYYCIGKEFNDIHTGGSGWN